MFVYHSISEDNEAKLATGWKDGQLSVLGRTKAEELRSAVLGFQPQLAYCSDLGRAVQTADLLLRDAGISVRFERSLRECDFGRLNGASSAVVHANDLDYLDRRYPAGESYAEAAERTVKFIRETILTDPKQHVLIIGHGVTRWALEQMVSRQPLAVIMARRETFRFPDDCNNQGRGWRYALAR